MEKVERYWIARAGLVGRGRSGEVPFFGGINTQRLRLRRLLESDADTIACLVSDREVSKQTTSIAHPYTLMDARKFTRDSDADWSNGVQYVLGMERRSDNALIGTVSVQIYRNWGRKRAEIGFWAGRDYWGEGYTTEAVEAFLVFCLASLGLRTIVAKAFAENEASLRLLKSVGFCVIGKKTENLPHLGGKRRIIHLSYTPK